MENIRLSIGALARGSMTKFFGLTVAVPPNSHGHQIQFLPRFYRQMTLILGLEAISANLRRINLESFLFQTWARSSSCCTRCFLRLIHNTRKRSARNRINQLAEFLIEFVRGIGRDILVRLRLISCSDHDADSLIEKFPIFERNNLRDSHRSDPCDGRAILPESKCFLDQSRASKIHPWGSCRRGKAELVSLMSFIVLPPAAHAPNRRMFGIC